MSTLCLHFLLKKTVSSRVQSESHLSTLAHEHFSAQLACEKEQKL
jgi:hypothetical protein